MKTLKFKLYQSKRNKHLKRSINAAGVIYNHCIALHKRYYRMWSKHLNCSKLQSHIAKIRKRKAFWQQVGSQAVQDICQRISIAYQLFFKHHKKGVRPPGFKKVRRYKSFTLKQAGYKFLDGNRIKIGNRVYQYWNSREIEGKVKTLTIKRTPRAPLSAQETGKKCFETLNLKGMQRLWGRKISDLAFGEFLQILEWVSKKKGKQVVFIDRWYPSSKTCSHCGHVLKELDLSVREWRCPSCQNVNDRDENAAINICAVGASTVKLGDVRQAMPAIAV
ncbi:MAG: RNA-guided endonuclease InsQ/TnpB family protein [Microcoleus sp.]